MITIPDKIRKIMAKFLAAEAEIYVVGGAVRDMLMGREVKDWDLTTNLPPEDIKKLFPKNSFYKNEFGTVSIVAGKEEIVEVTTYRTERGYSDNRHPDEITWGKTLQEDVKRRDFTINAMAATVDGEIIDYEKGFEDLNHKIIRAVGVPDQRFTEDALRMMRAIRIACQIGFLIEETTFKAITKNTSLINNIAAERVREELFLILASDHPADGVMMLKNCGLLTELIPELLEGYEMKQKGHHIYDVFTHSIKALQFCVSRNPVTRLATLLHDIGKPAVVKGNDENRTFHGHEVVGSRMAVKIGKRFKLSNKELDQLFRLTRWHMFTTEDTQTDSAVKRFIRNVTPEYLNEMIALRRSDRLGSGAKETSWRWELFKKRLIEVQKQPFTVKDLKIDGHDVMEILKIKPGRKVGEILDKLFAEVEADPKLNDREVLLQKIKEFEN